MQKKYKMFKKILNILLSYWFSYLVNNKKKLLNI